MVVERLLIVIVGNLLALFYDLLVSNRIQRVQVYILRNGALLRLNLLLFHEHQPHDNLSIFVRVVDCV